MVKESLYEQLFALTTVMKQRVVDNFDGDSLNERWTEHIQFSSPTFAMSDAVDEGFKISVNAVSAAEGGIFFNNIRQYSAIASIIIGEIKAVQSTDIKSAIGMFDDNVGAIVDFMFAGALTDGQTNYIIRTGNSGGNSTSASSIALDTIFHNHKVELASADSKYTIDGILEVTKTTDLPTGNLQPTFYVRNFAAVAKDGLIRYLEAFNT